MIRSILVIYRKELKETLRDRKTLIFMLAIPILVMPLLFDFGLQFAIDTATKADTETLQYAIFGDEHLPELAGEFAGQSDFERVDIADREAIARAIGSDLIDFALVVQAPSGDNDAAGPQTTVFLYYDQSSSTSRARARASAIIQGLSDKARSDRLTGLGVVEFAQPRILRPIEIIKINTADMRAVLGEQVGGVLPYLFIIFCLMGALYPAIDLGAGEKERGTLETLLLAPLPRQQIVLGKYLVIFTASVTAAFLSLTSMGLWLATRGKQIVSDLGGDLEIGAIIKSVGTLDLVLIAVMLVPTAAIFAAVLLSLSIYAKSFKEAQSYAAPLNFVAILPAVLAMLPGVELDWKWAMVPITNIALAVKELIKGTMNYHMLFAILGSTAVIAGALLVFCTWWFRRENVLFRQ
ncbi:MAG: ABC transporter permease [Proteobacteria bacterium]|nr:ABC transporter permease [Pseudomonadota bacterium]